MTIVRIITPIISTGFRDDTSLKTSLPADCEVTSMFLDKGPASVESAIDEVLAGPGVVNAAIEAERDGAQALVIDCMLDPALHAAREAVGIPVIGCGEAAMLSAAEHGPFSIVTVLQRQERAFNELAARYGIRHALLSVRGIGVPVLALETERDTSIEATIREAGQAVKSDGAHGIVFGCTGMLGFAEPVAQALGVPIGQIIDPLPFAVIRAHEAVLAQDRTDKASYPNPDQKATAGFDAWPALDELITAR